MEPGVEFYNNNYKAGILNKTYGGANYNTRWSNFISGYKFRGETNNEDMSKVYTTGIKIKIDNK